MVEAILRSSRSPQNGNNHQDSSEVCLGRSRGEAKRADRSSG